MKLVLLLLVWLLKPAAGKEFHFVLVHGGEHGAWCWYKVASKLQHCGHKVNTPDMISAGISSVDPMNVSSLEQYSSPLVELLHSLPNTRQAVLVGHSLGGASLTYALERFPEKILVAVYVAALMLPSGDDASTINNQLLATVFESSKELSVEELLYNLSPPEDVVLANTLRKPAPVFDPTVNFTSARYGSVPRYFIKTRQDKVISSEQQDWLIRTTPPNGVLEVNSDHSPFFSRPDTLVHLLVEVASLYFAKTSIHYKPLFDPTADPEEQKTINAAQSPACLIDLPATNISHCNELNLDSLHTQSFYSSYNPTSSGSEGLAGSTHNYTAAHSITEIYSFGHLSSGFLPTTAISIAPPDDVTLLALYACRTHSNAVTFRG